MKLKESHTGSKIITKHLVRVFATSISFIRDSLYPWISTLLGNLASSNRRKENLASSSLNTLFVPLVLLSGGSILLNSLSYLSISPELLVLLQLPPFCLLLLKGWTGTVNSKIHLQNELDASIRYSHAARVRCEQISGGRENASVSYDEIIRPSGVGSLSNAAQLIDMLERIRENAQSHRFEQRISILQPSRDYIDNAVEMGSSESVLALRLGILGTFIGFTIALLASGNLFENLFNAATQSEANVEHLKDVQQKLSDLSSELLGGLSLAFTTSVFGLIVSIIISAKINQTRNTGSRVLKSFTDATSFAMFLAQRASFADVGTISALSSVQEALKTTNTVVTDQSRQFRDHVIEHNKHADQHASLFVEATEKLITAKENWSNLIQPFEKINLNISTISSNIGQLAALTTAKYDEVYNDVDSRIKLSSNEIHDTVQDLNKSILDTTEFSRTILNKVNDELETTISESNSIKNNGQEIVNGLIEIKKSIHSLPENISQTLIQSNTAVLQANKKLNTSIDQLGEHVSNFSRISTTSHHSHSKHSFLNTITGLLLFSTYLCVLLLGVILYKKAELRWVDELLEWIMKFVERI